MNRKVSLLFLTFLLVLSFGKVSPAQDESISVRGTVVNELGDPLEGVKVVAYGVPGANDFTRSKGEFVLQFGIEDKGEKVTIMLSKKGYKPQFIDKYVVPETDAHLGPFKLETLFIEGCLVTSGRKPIVGAEIRVPDAPSLRASTDSNGHFKIKSDSLSYHPRPGIMIWIDLQEKTYEKTCRMNVEGNIIELELTAEAEPEEVTSPVRRETLPELKTTAAQACTAYFRITDPEHNPVKEARLIVDEIPYMLAVTDSRGGATLLFEADHVGKEVRIWITKEGYEGSYKDIILRKGTMSLIEAELAKLALALNPPRLKRPSHRTTLDDSTPTFEWEALNACTYNLQVDDESDFLSPRINLVDLTACHHEPKQRLKPGTYYWRVQAREKVTENYSRWGEPWIVTVSEPRQAAGDWDAAYRSLILPGWGQAYKGRPKLETGGFWLALGVSGVLSYWAHKEYRDHRDRYRATLKTWELLEEYDQGNKNYRLRNGLLRIGIPTLWIVNVVQAYISKDMGVEEESYSSIGYGLRIREGQVRLVFTKPF